ncbi:MAG: GTPase HflX [Elusimicrobia bacterium]|nr:GTPase HflX [Elusimicrobiota bacterium]
MTAETRIRERAVLVGAYLKGADPRRSSAGIEELKRLSETAGAVVAQTMTQRVARFHAGSLLGRGKIQEVADAARRQRARTVIFDLDLSPAQQKCLEEELGAKIIDRTRLILDIFAKRARTKEGELQVELAQLSYMLPRLTGAWRGFSQQVGGIGTRGPGERKLEYERRHIQRRIQHLKGDIERIKRQRAVQRRRRLSVPVPAVAIIGYTNVGKSSLLNALTRAGTAYADDKLFATLDPTTRRVRLPKGGFAVFTDTVGFISNLPTTLVAAFRSTLEEVLEADCLVHIVDAASADQEAQASTVLSILKDLGAEGVPLVTAFNKSDLLGASGRKAALAADPRRLFISAATGEGLGAMLDHVQEVLNRRWLQRELAVGLGDGRLVDEIHRCAQVLDQRSERGRWILRLRVTPENWSRLMARTKMVD